MSTGRPTALLLNAGHALDHLFLLIFATAVGAIAADWGMVWQDLMPYTVGAFVMFGLGSLPAGRLGDLWGRRAMMVIFFLGMGVSGLLIALTSGVWTLAISRPEDRKSTRLNSSHLVISYAVFCLKKKTQDTQHANPLYHPGTCPIPAKRP